MFSTLEGDQFDLPGTSALAAPNTSYWRIVGLTSMLPWYVVTYRARVYEAKSVIDILQSCLVTSDEDLIETIQRHGFERVVSIFRATCSAGRTPWRFLAISELWLPPRQEIGVLMLHAVQGDTSLYDVWDNPVDRKEEQKFWPRRRYGKEIEHEVQK